MTNVKTMPTHAIASREEWERARQTLLVEEKGLTPLQLAMGARDKEAVALLMKAAE